MKSIAVLLLLLFPKTLVAIPRLSQVHVISRHGSRLMLSKTANGSRTESGQSLLTPLGEKQLYELGTWLRQRYGPNGLQLLDQYDANQVRFESSDLERTISSANALSLGLFPPTSRGSSSLLPEGIYKSIPVYMSERRNDVYIRAYEKCPTFHDNLMALYQSDEWTGLETQYKTFLTDLAAVEAFSPYKNSEGFIPLHEIWNLYDIVNVQTTECAQEENPSLQLCGINATIAAALLSGDEWKSLELMAHYAELARYSTVTAGDLLAGNLLLKIHERMGGPQIGSPHENAFRGRTFYHYSAHYPTLLGIFASLNLNDLPQIKVIPEYGSAIIFEFFKDEATGEDEVYMLYKKGNSTKEESVHLSGACRDASECPLSDFTNILSNLSYSSPQEWCTACGNIIADVCLLQQVQGGGAPHHVFTPSPFVLTTPIAPTPAPAASQEHLEPASPPSIKPSALHVSDFYPTREEEFVPVVCAESNNNSSEAGAIAGAFFGGFGLGILVLVATRYLLSLRTGIEKQGDTDDDDPDNIIDLDFSRGVA